MLILDDLLLAPFKGIYWVGKEIHEAVLTEQSSHAARQGSAKREAGSPR